MPAPNSLAEILDRLHLPADARVLDIGGPAYRGEESTTYLSERFGRPIDVIAAREDQRAEMTARFGKRIRLLPDEGQAEPHSYDLVVISPVLGKVAETLLDAGWRGARLLRPGGVVITFGIDPGALGMADHKHPEPAVAEAFHAAFGGRHGAAMALPAWMAESWDLIENTPRKPAFRSYLTWTVLRRRADASPGSLVEGMGAEADHEALELLLRQDFDTVLVFDPARRDATRTRRIADTLRALGRRMLWIESGGEALEVGNGPGGGILLRLRDAADEIDRRRRIAGLSGVTDEAGRLEAEVLGARLGRLAAMAARPGMVVFSQGSRALRAVQAGLTDLKLRQPGKAALLRWVHDRLDPRLDEPEGRARGGASRRPDVVIAAGPGGPDRTRIRDAQALADKFIYRGKTLQLRLGTKEPIIAYSGDGEGCDLARLGDLFAGGPPFRLAVLAGRTSPQAKALRRSVRQHEADERLCLLPIPVAHDIPGAIADAELGLIGVDEDGRPEAGEAARFSDYLLAGLPVVAPRGGEVADILETWPIGCVYDPSDPQSLAAAVTEGLARRAELAAALSLRPDLLLRFAWESQAIKLRDILMSDGRPGRRSR